MHTSGIHKCCKLPNLCNSEGGWIATTAGRIPVVCTDSDKSWKLPVLVTERCQCDTYRARCTPCAIRRKCRVSHQGGIDVHTATSLSGGLVAGVTGLTLVAISSRLPPAVAAPWRQNPPVNSPDGGDVSIIVRAANVHSANEAVATAHGQVTRRLPIIDAVAATIPQRAVGVLASTPGVRDVIPDCKMHVQSVELGARVRFRRSPARCTARRWKHTSGARPWLAWSRSDRCSSGHRHLGSRYGRTGQAGQERPHRHVVAVCGPLRRTNMSGHLRARHFHGRHHRRRRSVLCRQVHRYRAESQSGIDQGGVRGWVRRRQHSPGWNPVGGVIQRSLRHQDPQPVTGDRLDAEVDRRPAQLCRGARLGGRDRCRRLGK